MRNEVAIGRSITVIAVLGVIAALYFAKPVFLPLALAMLLTFLLAPAVRRLQTWGLPKLPAVVLVVAFAFTVILGIGALVAQQVTTLTHNLPVYQYNIEEKIRSVREFVGGGTLERISNFLGDLNQEARKKSDTPQRGAAPQPAEDLAKPIPVEVHQPGATPMQVAERLLQPLVDPLTTAGLVVIFVIFFLLQRQNLRDRLIRLAGSHDLQRTTDAIDDGAQRLSRYFLAQTALNVLFGLIVGIALTFIGVPNPVLFGILAMLLRFVPYIGAFIAAIFPIALAVAVDPGWGMPLMTTALFLLVEPLIGQVIEPLVYGHSTGLTPVAVIIAATFWTWLWGPIGLLLSTPLTVCLGVLGRHIPWLHFLDVMIGDEPALSPAQSFYQRALAADIDEAADQAEEMLSRRSLSYVYDKVVLEALNLAQIDFRRGLLDPKHVEQINEAVHELIADTNDYEDVTPPVVARKDNDTTSENEEPPSLPDLPVLRDLPPEWGGKPVLCVAGRGPFDDAVARMLIQLLEKHGLGGSVETNAAVSSSNIERLNSAGVMVVCLSYLDLGSSPAHLRHSIKRVRRQITGAKLVVGLWGHGDVKNRGQPQTTTPADFYVSSLREAMSLCIDAVSGGGAKSPAPASKGAAGGIEKEAPAFRPGLKV
jgi:predicted PurR-regulated permease PerM